LFSIHTKLHVAFTYKTNPTACTNKNHQISSKALKDKHKNHRQKNTMGVLDEAFIQAPEHRPKTHLKHSDDHILSKEIPTIDLSSLQDPNCDKTALATEIAEACMRWGFFQVINHGLSLDLMRRVEKTVAEFFSLTLEEKRRVKRDEVNPMGYHDGEHTKNVRDWKEIFDFFLQDSTTVPATTEPEDTELRKLTNPWPQNPSDFR